MIAGPDARSRWKDATSPIRPDSDATAAATAIMAGSVVAQSRATAAGSIISPTAISVPSAWKPATRFATTRNRNRRW